MKVDMIRLLALQAAIEAAVKLMNALNLTQQQAEAVQPVLKSFNEESKKLMSLIESSCNERKE